MDFSLCISEQDAVNAAIDGPKGSSEINKSIKLKEFGLIEVAVTKRTNKILVKKK